MKTLWSKWSNLPTRTRVSIIILIVSMVVFPYGLLSGSNLIAIIGWTCFTVGVLVDRNRKYGVTS